MLANEGMTKNDSFCAATPSAMVFGKSDGDRFAVTRDLTLKPGYVLQFKVSVQQGSSPSEEEQQLRLLHAWLPENRVFLTLLKRGHTWVKAPQFQDGITFLLYSWGKQLARFGGVPEVVPIALYCSCNSSIIENIIEFFDQSWCNEPFTFRSLLVCLSVSLVAWDLCFSVFWWSSLGPCTQ